MGDGFEADEFHENTLGETAERRALVGATGRSPLRFHGFYFGWMVFVFQPFHGIIFNVFPNFLQIDFVADDMFVIISLPDGVTRGAMELVDSFGDGGFEPGDKGSQRFWGQCAVFGM
jgi:hypothetical protein